MTIGLVLAIGGLIRVFMGLHALHKKCEEHHWRQIHHAYLGAVVLAAGGYIPHDISYLVQSVGLWWLVDDLWQHEKQLQDCSYRSFWHNAWAKVAGRFYD